MMRTVIVSTLFILTMLIDGILMPGLFHVWDSALAFILLAALVAGFGAGTWTIVLGIALAFSAELFQGLHPGELVIGFLVMALLWQIMTRFVNLNPYLEERGNILPYVVMIMILTVAGWTAAGAIAAFYGAFP